MLETGSWASAFHRDGSGIDGYSLGTQGGVFPCVVEHVDVELPRAVGDHMPTVVQLEPCWPRRQRVPEADIWRRAPPFPEPKNCFSEPHAPQARRASVRLRQFFLLGQPLLFPVVPRKRPARCR